MRNQSSNGFSSQVKNKIDNKTYLISTAKHPSGIWETAIFKVNFLGVSNPFKPLRIERFDTYEDAEKEHSRCEEAVEYLPMGKWDNTADKDIIFTKRDVSFRQDTEFIQSSTSEKKGHEHKIVIKTCPRCGTKNRVPDISYKTRIPICGKCKEPLTMQEDEEFIASLKSTVKKNRLDIIPDEELYKICTRARSIAAFSNTLDIGLSAAINTLSEEIKKRGLPQENKHDKINSYQTKKNHVPDITDTSPSTGTKSCPFCAEEISEQAIKCKHCGSTLDGSSIPQKISSGLSDQTIQQISLQTNFTLIPNENILIDGQSSYVKSTWTNWNNMSGHAYLTNYRLIFCSNVMNSTMAEVLTGGAVGYVARQVFKATKINFQLPISEISSVTKEKRGFSSKYTVNTKSGTTYALAFPKGDKWMSIMGTLGVECIV